MASEPADPAAPRSIAGRGVPPHPEIWGRRMPFQGLAPGPAGTLTAINARRRRFVHDGAEGVRRHPVAGSPFPLRKVTTMPTPKLTAADLDRIRADLEARRAALRVEVKAQLKGSGDDRGVHRTAGLRTDAERVATLCG